MNNLRTGLTAGVLALALIGGPRAQAQNLGDQLKDIFGIGKLNIPGLDKIPGLQGGVASLLNDDPLTTNLKDAWDGLPFLDGFSPAQYHSMASMKKSADGSLAMRPGAYAGIFKSYCLKPGTYEPTKGNGYLNAPLKGKRAGIISRLLKVETDVPGAPTQEQMQSLLWAILARGKYSSFSPELRSVGDRYLSPEDRFELDGGAIGLIPDDIKQNLFGKIDQALKPLIEAQDQLRSITAKANLQYAELEKYAVLAGMPPSHKEDREIPRGRWMLQKSGVFVRYAPDGYPRTRVDTYLPEKFLISTDALGRVTKIEEPEGSVLEITYGGAVLPTGAKELQGHTITSWKFSGAINREVSGGWTLVGFAPKKTKAKEDPNFPGSTVRLEQSFMRQTQCDAVKKRYPRDKKKGEGEWAPPTQVYNVLNLRDALASALWSGGQSEAGKAEHEFLTRATMAGLSDWVAGREQTTLLASLVPGLVPTVVGYDDQDTGPLFDPTEVAAMPARTHGQRIGISPGIVVGPGEEPEDPKPVTAVAFFGGARDEHYQHIMNYETTFRAQHPSARVRYFNWMQHNEAVIWLQNLPRGSRVNIVGYSYGGDTAGEVAEEVATVGRVAVQLLITLDGVSTFRTPNFAVLQRVCTLWYNVNAIGDGRDNTIAIAGKPWNEGPRGFSTYFEEELDHGQPIEMLRSNGIEDALIRLSNAPPTNLNLFSRLSGDGHTRLVPELRVASRHPQAHTRFWHRDYWTTVVG